MNMQRLDVATGLRYGLSYGKDRLSLVPEPGMSQPCGPHLSPYQQHHYQSALADFQRRCEANPQSVELWYEWGEALANLGLYIEALDSFDKALRLQPEHVASLIFRGVVLIHLERYKEALDSCDRALSLYPDDKEAWIFRGVALYHLGLYKQAYSSYDRALDVQHPALWQKLTQYLHREFAGKSSALANS